MGGSDVQVEGIVLLRFFNSNFPYNARTRHPSIFSAFRGIANNFIAIITEPFNLQKEIGTYQEK